MKESWLLRLLDRYIGGIFCFFFSLFRHRRITAEPPRRALFIELFEMGAAVMAIPSITHLQSRVPGCEIYVLTVRGNAESWLLTRKLDEKRILALDGKNLWRFAVSLARHIVALRRLRIDLVIDLEKFSRISTLSACVIGAKRVAGFYRYEYEGLYRGDGLIDARCAFNQNMHISKNFLALTKTALHDRDDYPNYKGAIPSDELTLPPYVSDPALAGSVRAALKADPDDPIVVMCPDVGSNLRVRNYPVESYASVAEELLASDDRLRIVLIGTPENLPVCTDLENLVRSERVRNLCGETSTIYELMELFCMSTLLIGNDNGPLHFASLTPIRILGLFSTDSPYMYGPLGNCVVLYSFLHCSPCISALNHKRSRCKDNVCLRSIPSSTVVQTARRLLAGELPYRSINGMYPYLV